MALRALQGPTGGGTPVGGTGTPNTIPRWTGASTLGDSLLSQSGTVITSAGTGLAFTGAQAWTLAVSTSALDIASGLLKLDTTNSRISVKTTLAGASYYQGITITDAATTTIGFGLQNIGGTSQPFIYGNTALGFGTNLANRMVIDGSGNVGIGTATPVGRADVAGTSVNQSGWGLLSVQSNDAQGADKGGSITFGGVYDASTATHWAQISGRKENGTSGQYGGYLAFATRTNGAGTNTERARIDSAGRLLVGTSTVASSTDVRQIVAKTGDVYTQYANTTTNGGTVVGSLNSGFGIYTYTGGIGSESYVERLRVSPSGTQAQSQVAIGTSSFTTGRALTTVADLDVFSLRVGRGANGVSRNSAFGVVALDNASLSGNDNTGIGYAAGSSITSGASNSGLGSYALSQLQGGSNNVAVGFAAMYSMVATSGNSAVGFEAGRYISSGAAMTDATDSVLIGRDARANANSETNQIVIGTAARGNGSNTTTIGNSSTVGTFFATKYTRIVTAYTVATLPAAGTVGREARVSDGDAGLAWGATVVNTGAGATPYLVWDNGTNWTVVGK